MVRNSRHLFAGVLFVLFGFLVIWLASLYKLGTATNMGPGYFPMALGIVLACLGAVAVIQALRANTDDAVGDFELLPLFFLTASVVAFGLLVDRIGLVGSTFALVLLSSYNRILKKPIEVLSIASVLSILCVGLFVYGVDLGFSAF